MRPLVDQDHAELKAILSALLLEDVDVSAREVARRHRSLKNVTAFTRNDARAQLIDAARIRQREIRAVVLAHLSQLTTRNAAKSLILLTAKP